MKKPSPADLTVQSSMPDGRAARALLALALPLCAALLLAGCAGRNSVNKMLDSAGNMYVTTHYLGAPDSSSKLPGGGTRYEWHMDRVVLEPAHYETRRVFMWYDSDGFPVYEDVEFWVPAQHVRQTCHVVVLADSEDRILEHSAQGSHCDKLFKVPSNY